MARPRTFTKEEAQERERERIRLAQRERRAKGRLVIDLGERLTSTLKGYAASSGLTQTQIVTRALESYFNRQKLLSASQPSSENHE
jgi:chemotaxis protein histidine kinase CheA